jgi:phosphoribosylaminoimidazole carboxylase PurE protein
MDALLSTVQMPSGIPVATVAVGSGGAKNAAVLAAQILGLKYPAVAEKVKAHRNKLTEKASERADSWPSYEK